MNSTQSAELKNNFVSQNLPQKKFRIEKLPADASFREYSRVYYGNKTAILMDSSKELKSMESFIKIDNILLQKGFSVPKILAQDTHNGFLLLEDFGDYTYTKLLADRTGQESESELYKKAIDVLISLQKQTTSKEIPLYSNEILMKEVLLMIEWYFPTLHNTQLPEKLQKEYKEIWEVILAKLQYKDSCIVLRDYHIDNVMLLPNRHGIREVGLLDFQDALIGSYAYDFISLMEDARRDIHEDLFSEMLHYYISKTPQIDKQKFLTDIKIIGMQRTLKIIGTFTRKASRDGDSRYLVHMPRLWKYVSKRLNEPTFDSLKNWFKKADINIGI